MCISARLDSCPHTEMVDDPCSCLSRTAEALQWEMPRQDWMEATAALVGAGGEALAAAGAALADGLLQAAEAAHHARCPLHLVPVGRLLVAQVARKALPAAREPQPPACSMQNKL